MTGQDFLVVLLLASVGVSCTLCGCRMSAGYADRLRQQRAHRSAEWRRRTFYRPDDTDW